MSILEKSSWKNVQTLFNNTKRKWELRDNAQL